MDTLTRVTPEVQVSPMRVPKLSDWIRLGTERHPYQTYNRLYEEVRDNDRRKYVVGAVCAMGAAYYANTDVVNNQEQEHYETILELSKTEIPASVAWGMMEPYLLEGTHMYNNLKILHERVATVSLGDTVVRLNDQARLRREVIVDMLEQAGY